MAITFTPAAPWTAGASVVGSNGVQYVATAAYSLKVDCPEEVVDTDTWMTIVDNGDGTFTGTNVDGSQVTWTTDTDTFTTIVDNGDGTYTGTNADGTQVTWSSGVTPLDCPVNGNDPEPLTSASRVLTPANAFDVDDWPFENCPVTNGRRIHKGEDGRLYTDPPTCEVLRRTTAASTEIAADFVTGDNVTSAYIYGPGVCLTVPNNDPCRDAFVYAQLILQVSQEGSYGDGQTRQILGRSEYSCDGGNTWTPWNVGFEQNWAHSLATNPGQQQKTMATSTAYMRLPCRVPAGGTLDFCLRTGLLARGPNNSSAARHIARAQSWVQDLYVRTLEK